MNKKYNQSGQVLLIIILLSAVLLTIGLSVTKIGTNDTKIAKLEEENKKALAAAEAGIDLALKSSIGSEVTIPIEGITGSAIVEGTTQSTFVSPIISKDSQFVFYLSDYPSFSNPFAKSVNVYYQAASSASEGMGPGSQTVPALEITLIKNDNTIKRYVIDSGNRVTNPIVPSTFSGSIANYPEYTFNYFTTISQADIGAVSKMLIVRVLYADTRIGFQGFGLCTGSCNLPLQGKTVTSTAKTSTGVQKKIQLFQSYPQIPADFFITSF